MSTSAYCHITVIIYNTARFFPRFPLDGVSKQ